LPGNAATNYKERSKPIAREPHNQKNATAFERIGNDSQALLGRIEETRA
jgi:hypothetical protein